MRVEEAVGYSKKGTTDQSSIRLFFTLAKKREKNFLYEVESGKTW